MIFLKEVMLENLLLEGIYFILLFPGGLVSLWASLKLFKEKIDLKKILKAELFAFLLTVLLTYLPILNLPIHNLFEANTLLIFLSISLHFVSLKLFFDFDVKKCIKIIIPWILLSTIWALLISGIIWLIISISAILTGH